VGLWDCDDAVAAVPDATGAPEDLPLSDPRILIRLQVAMTQRRITVTTTSANDCALCRPAR
jgi:hypothetical protein